MSFKVLDDFHALTTTIGGCLVVGAATTSAYALTLSEKEKRLLLKLSTFVASFGFSLGIAGDMLAAPNGSIGIAENREITQCPLDKFQEALTLTGKDSTSYKFFEVLNKTRGINCHNFLPFNTTFFGKHYGDFNISREVFGQEPVLWSITPYQDPLITIHYACQSGLDTVSTLYYVTRDFIGTSSSGNQWCFPLRARITVENLDQFQELFKTGSTSFRQGQNGFETIKERISLVEPQNLIYKTASILSAFFSRGQEL